MTARSEFFRASVGAVIVDDKGNLLAFQRARTVEHAWQLPQGGLELCETPPTAVLREIREETGIAPESLTLVAEAPEWLAYELPEEKRSAKTGRGQVQKWYLFRFVGSDKDIQPDGEEFLAWRWMTSDQLLKSAVAFRRPVYMRLFDVFGSHLGRAAIHRVGQ